MPGKSRGHIMADRTKRLLQELINSNLGRVPWEPTAPYDFPLGSGGLWLRGCTTQPSHSGVAGRTLHVDDAAARGVDTRRSERLPLILDRLRQQLPNGAHDDAAIEEDCITAHSVRLPDAAPVRALSAALG